MLPLPFIIGAVSSIFILSIVGYVLYYKFNKLDNKISSNNDKLNQLVATDKDLKNVDVNLVKTNNDLLAKQNELSTTLNNANTNFRSENDSIRKSIEDTRASLTNTTKSLGEKTTSLQNSVDSEKKYTTTEFKSINNRLNESKNSINTRMLNANMINGKLVTGEVVFSDLDWHNVSFGEMSAHENLLSDKSYTTNLATSGISVYNDVWNSNTSKKVYNLDKDGYSWQTGAINAGNYIGVIGDGPYSLDTRIGMFANGKYGTSLDNYNGGLEALESIGFRNRLTKKTSLLNNTKNGDTTITGKMTANNGFLVGNSNMGPLIERNFAGSNRDGIGKFQDGVYNPTLRTFRMYADTDNFALSHSKSDGKFDDIFTADKYDFSIYSDRLNVENMIRTRGGIRSIGPISGGNITTSGNTSLGSNLYVNGNTGIGTSNPSTKLHVIGGTLFTGGHSLFENNIGLKENAQLSMDGTTTGPPRLFVQNQSAGGNIGIGTSSPASKLHVVGNGLFTGSGTFTGDVKGGRLCIGSTCVTEAKLQKLNSLP